MVASARQQATFDCNKSSDYDKLCWAISELECREKSGNHVDVRQNVNVQLKSRLVKLIGEKPLFSCELEGIASSVLWDTGSMINVADRDWVQKNTPHLKLRPITDF